MDKINDHFLLVRLVTVSLQNEAIAQNPFTMDNEVEQEGVTASIVVWCVGLSLALLTPLLLFVIQFYWQLKRPIPKKSKKTKDSESEETKGKEETLIFRNLSFSVPTAQGDKTIVNNVSGIVRPGELCALMGQSGAGFVILYLFFLIS